MALTPDEITNHDFSTVRRRGLDPAEVKAFLGRIAEQLADHQDALLRAGVAIDRLSSEATRRGVVDPVDPDAVGKLVGRIISQSEAAARAVVADAEADASRTRTEADHYAARVRADVEDMRARAETEVDVFRRDTLAHAAQIRAEAEQTLETMQVEAEARIREVQRAASVDLEARLEAVRTAERLMLERLVATAEDVSTSLRRFHTIAVEDAAPTAPQALAPDALPADDMSSDALPADDLRADDPASEAADDVDIDLTGRTDESARRPTHLRPVAVGQDPAPKPQVDVARFAAWDGPAAVSSGG